MPLNAPRVTHMHSTPDGDDVDMDEEGDSELEEEIDQLDSDTEDEVPVAVISTSSRPRARQKKPAERVPGVVLLPLDRLENILEPDGQCLLCLQQPLTLTVCLQVLVSICQRRRTSCLLPPRCVEAMLVHVCVADW